MNDHLRAACFAGVLVLACSPRLQSRSTIGSDQPDGTLRQVQDVPVRGAEIDVEVINAPDVSGELLAVEDGRLWVWDGERIHQIPLGQIHEVEVQLEPGVTGWVILGAVSTVTHGFWLVLTLPAWVATGIPASQATESYVSGDDLLRILHEYARYPQGMPKAASAAASVRANRDDHYWMTLLKSRMTPDAGEAGAGADATVSPPPPPAPSDAADTDAGTALTDGG